MQKRDLETYQKRFRDFEILPKFSENHVFRGTIHHPYQGQPIQGKNLSRDILVSKEEFKNRIDQYSVTKRTSLLPFFNCCLRRLGIWSGPSNTKTKNSQCEHFEHINDYYHFFFFTTLNELLFSESPQRILCVLQFTVYIFIVGYYDIRTKSGH